MLLIIEGSMDEIIISLLSSTEKGFLLSLCLLELPIPIQRFSTFDSPNITASRCPKWNG
jgi:hypothetical protein